MAAKKIPILDKKGSSVKFARSHEETHDDTHIVPCFVLIPINHPSIMHRLVDEGVYDRSNEELCELSQIDDEQLIYG